MAHCGTHYRKGSKDKRCGTCEFGFRPSIMHPETLRCYDAGHGSYQPRVGKNMVCDAWAESEKIQKAEGMMKYANDVQWKMLTEELDPLT